MLHEAQRTSAPSSRSVSMSTAVWMVMWSEPVMRWPLSGFFAAYSLRTAMRPGISFSASSISLGPHWARRRSFTLNSFELDSRRGAGTFFAARAVLGISSLLVLGVSGSGDLSGAPGSGCTGDEEGGALGGRLRGQGGAGGGLEAQPEQELGDGARIEATARLAHAAAEVVVVMADEVGQDHDAAGLEDARRFGQDALRFRCVGEREHEQGRVTARVLERQRFQIGAAQLHVRQRSDP